MEKLSDYKAMLRDKSPMQVIEWALGEFGKRIILASSFGAEDQVLTDMIASTGKPARFFTLDTGRLFQETYDTMQKSMERYSINYEVYAPNPDDIARMIEKCGPNLFYESVEKRRQCCDVRKLRPLKKVLKTVDAWICGLRRAQSITRTDVDIISWDEQFGIYKICPLFDWSEEDIWKYIKEQNVPYNPLHDSGFRSIGCVPCTRATKHGEDERAGRWWWESPEKKECGLHRKSEKNK